MKISESVNRFKDRKDQWGRRLEGWPNTAARLAGWRRVTQKGVILYLVDGPNRLPWLSDYPHPCPGLWLIHRVHRGKDEIGWVYLLLAGAYTATLHVMTHIVKGSIGVHLPPSSFWAYFSIMMECTPENGRCKSMYSVGWFITKCTQNAVMSYVTQGRHGLVL